MAILAGIDEAGYGPLLGPLVVTGVAFRVPDEHVDRCLWETLSLSCARSAQGAGSRLVIADSKILYRSRKTLTPLERAVLVFQRVQGRAAASWRGLFDELSPGACADLDEQPWYRGSDFSLPVCDDVGDLGLRANAVRRDMRTRGMSFCGASAEPLLAGEYNRRVGNTRNKAAVEVGLVLRVIDRILCSAPGEHVRFLIDRLGGRLHYRDLLQSAMPEYELQIVEESPAKSIYRLTCSTRVCEIAFVTGGDDRHFVVALASLYSKYMRELCMRSFNDFWCRHMPELRPTAGYYNDALRWLGEAKPVIKRLGVDRSCLVRDR